MLFMPRTATRTRKDIGILIPIERYEVTTMNKTYTKLRDFAQKRLDDSCENDCNNDIRYWVGYLVGLNALYKKLYRTEETLEKQIPKKLHFGEALGYKDIYWHGYFDGLIALYKEYRQEIDRSEVEE